MKRLRKDPRRYKLPEGILERDISQKTMSKISQPVIYGYIQVFILILVKLLKMA